MAMLPRGRLVATLRHQRPDRVPKDAWFTVEPIIPDFLEVGVDALHPIQPESMDPFRIKKRWSGRLTLWGTVGAQSVLPFGTPGQVREVVRRNVEGLGYNGGLWIAPSQALLPGVPWKNIAAFLEAVEESA